MAYVLALAAFVDAANGNAAEPALNALGQTGGLVIPYGFVLPQGMVEAQYGNYIDPNFDKNGAGQSQATGSQVYWGAVGLLPYVELSAGLTNYPATRPAPFSDADHFLLRHLSGNFKVQLPTFFQYQPSIAFGMTDFGGQTHYFRSTYGVVSQQFGPLALSAGYGSGQRLDGPFGGAQLSIWNTGISLLAEDDSTTPYAGLRYQSPRISWLANANVVATITRALKSTVGASPRTSFSIGVQIPLGQRFEEPPCNAGTCDGSLSADTDMSARPDWAPANVNGTPENYQAPEAAITKPISATAENVQSSLLLSSRVSPEESGSANDLVARNVEAADVSASLDDIAAKLFSAGLERVRVGVSGHDLIVEYENHRYNQNEADALGIVLGIASLNAPPGTDKIRVIIKKANEPLAQLTVDSSSFASFVRGGSATSAGASMTMQQVPTYRAETIEWHGDESRHGWSRIEVAPVMSYLYGTDYGMLDASLAANIQAFVPLWKGAEFYASYIAPFYNTSNMDDGRVYSQYRLRGGLSTVSLNQSFRISPDVLNVSSVGRFDYSYIGIENETTVFVPGRPDLVRLKLAYLDHEPGHDNDPTEKNAMLSYRWVQPAWKLWVERASLVSLEEIKVLFLLLPAGSTMLRSACMANIAGAALTPAHQ